MPTFSHAFVAGRQVNTPEYTASKVIDAKSDSELAADLYVAAKLQGATEQQAVNTDALSALSTLRAESIGHGQRLDMLSKQFNDNSTLHIANADALDAVRSDAAEALRIAKSVPSVDVAAVARLSAETVENGLRTLNQSAQSQQLIEQLTTDTLAQTEALKAEVEALQGSATATVEAIQQASSAAVEQAQQEVSQLLAGVPDDVAAAVTARLDQVEILTGGRVKDPSDERGRFVWEWTFGRLGSPEEVTRVVEQPILPGWTQPARSQAPILGGGSGGGPAASLLGAKVDIDTQASREVELRFTSLTNVQKIAGDATFRFKLTEIGNADSWASFTLDSAAAPVNANNQTAEFTVAPELIGAGGAPDFSFRVFRDSSGILSLFITTGSPCNVQGTISAITTY